VSRRDLYDVEFLTERRGFSIVGDDDLIRTDDGGRTWDPVPLPSGFRVLGISVHQPRAVWLTGNVCSSAGACRGRILRNADGGASWTELRFRASVPPLATQWLSPTYGVAHFGEAGQYVTGDGGRTWRFVLVR
jgi:photosystem II stability/assembly factor-like uncharacterized protein